MKRLFFTLAAIVLCVGLTGCNRQYVNPGCGWGVGDVSCGMAAGIDGYDGTSCDPGIACVDGNDCCGGLYGHERCHSADRRLREKPCRGHRCHNMIDPGPPVAQVAYPYYTVRGPRDFFCKNPPSIGP